MKTSWDPSEIQSENASPLQYLESMFRVDCASLLTRARHRLRSKTTRGTGANWIIVESSSRSIVFRCGMVGGQKGKEEGGGGGRAAIAFVANGL